ncbi:unnamed protein product [Mesocestoides corti]|uniref:E3 UFM1-protein ligase 1 homolog n=1 Tax=Mesocestoides corti TaxID=53468 RepID=A0A0R3U633_MESCO|nr:unnamed protein product [Mesocestoides corti]
MSGWSEIRDLAEKLKSVQSAESANILSHHACVDIVTYLINSGRLQLFRTINGRSLLTNNELNKEIFEELEAHGGHTTILEISKNLDVEYSLIESRVQELVASKSNDFFDETCILVGGDLMTKSFVKSVAEEIRDRLEFRGSMSFVELTRMYNFPPQFIMDIINDYNGVLFNIHKEEDKFYTDSFISKQKAKALGYFSGLITPIAISTCSMKLDIPQKLLINLVEALISSNKLKGSLIAGGKNIYTPLCYSRAQDAYVTAFFKQNRYIEWNIVRHIGIPDPSSYLRSHFPSAIHTKEFTICESTVSQIKELLADGASENQWVDVFHYLPQAFGAQEREWLIGPLLKNTPFVPIHEYRFLCHKDSLLEYVSFFEDFIRERAVVAATDQKQKAASKSAEVNVTLPDDGHSRVTERKGKSGGFGGRAREVKTKNVKKKYLKKAVESDSDNEEASTLACDSYLPREELFSILTSRIAADAPEELVDGIIDKLLPEIYDKFSGLCKSVLLQTSGASRNRDRFLAEKESLVSAILSIQLFERGALAVDDPSLRSQLLRQLIRGDVSTFVNRLCVFLAQNYDVDWPSAVQSNTSSKNRKNKHIQREVEEASSKSPNDLTPVEITAQQRDTLVHLLANLGAGPTKEASGILQHLNACLRASPELPEAVEGLPLDEVFNLCDELAAGHLGVNLSVSLLRGGAAKRKRQDRALALDLAAQTEQQMIAAASAAEADTNSLALVALAAAGLFGHCLAGWPLPVCGKLVPQLSAWIAKKLASPSSNCKSYPAAVKELHASKAGQQLSRVTDLVMHKTRVAEGAEGKEEEEEGKKKLIEQIVLTASRCRQAMQGSVASS